jgi:hypothetical protein
LFEIFIPILGPLFAGINSLGNTVTNAMEGVNGATEIVADTFKKIADESKTQPDDSTELPSQMQMKGGLLLRRSSQTRKRKKSLQQRGGNKHQMKLNAIQKAIQEVLQTT